MVPKLLLNTVIFFYLYNYKKAKYHSLITNAIRYYCTDSNGNCHTAFTKV